jgi:pilus assembly protein CpaB
MNRNVRSALVLSVALAAAGAASFIVYRIVVSEAKLASLGSGDGLPPTIPQGMRAISVRTNEVVGVAGFVSPGTRVDVLVTVRQGNGQEPISRAVVSNVEVLTAGTRYDQKTARQEGKAIPTTVVTLLVTRDQAERVALAASEGKIALTSRAEPLLR